MRVLPAALGLWAVATSAGCVERLIPQIRECGDGEFAPGEACLFGDGPRQAIDTPGLMPVSIRGADFTGDGPIDLLVMGSDAAGVVAGRTLAGDGRGRMQAPVDAGLFGCSAHPVPGRVDGAGPVDLLVDECSESVSLFLGQPDGVFAGPMSVFVGARTRSSGLVDLTDDGVNEVMVLGTDPGGSAVLSVVLPENFGLAAPVTIPVEAVGGGPFSPTGFGVARSGADLRVVLIDPTVRDGLAIMGHPLRRGAVERLRVGFTPAGAAIADFDEDGDDELLVGSVEGDAWVTLDVDEPGAPVREVGRTPASVTLLSRQIVDIDGDDHLDIVVSQLDQTTLTVWRGRGDGTFRIPFEITAGLVPEQFFLADLNGDTAPDLVAGELTAGEIVVVLAEP